MYDSYQEDIPYELRAAYYQGVDRWQRCELDADFMAEIDRLFAGSLK